MIIAKPVNKPAMFFLRNQNRVGCGQEKVFCSPWLCEHSVEIIIALEGKHFVD